MMSRLIKLARADSVEEGVPVAVNHPDFPPLAVYRVGDRLFVTDNVCTHGNAFMHEGFQAGLVIECPFHGGTFNIETGAPLAAPCTVPLKTYVVVVMEGHVCIGCEP